LEICGTEVFGALVDHLAVDLPQSITDIDDLESIRKNLVPSDDVLYMGRMSTNE
jgi:hypothetical protein